MEVAEEEEVLPAVQEMPLVATDLQEVMAALVAHRVLMRQTAFRPPQTAQAESAAEVVVGAACLQVQAVPAATEPQAAPDRRGKLLSNG